MSCEMFLNLDYPFEDYRVSSDGQVFNREGMVLKPHINRNGYSMVFLHGHGVTKNCSVHRLVASAFLPNSANKRTVNHIDGNKQNNDISNLEWATHSEQQKHAYAHNLRKSYLTQEDRINGARISSQLSRKKVYVRETGDIYPSLTECARDMRLSKSGISRCCNGVSDNYRGYHFSFIDGGTIDEME